MVDTMPSQPSASEAPGPATTTARKRRSDAERSQEALVASTIKLILAEGDVNISAVARDAGVSRVTLYTHFPTKEDLVEAALQHTVQRTEQLLAAIPDEGPATEVITRILRTSWQQVHENTNLHAVAQAVLPPGKIQMSHGTLHTLLSQLLERGQAEGDVRTDLPRPWLISVAFALVHLAAEQSHDGQADPDQIGETLVETVLSVLAPR